jgi:hypothetical protein
MFLKKRLIPTSSPGQYLKQNGVSRLNAIRFWLKIGMYWLLSCGKLTVALLTKKAYVGPFKGEFGNFLGHVLPFISFLHKRGVKVYFCGFEILKPYLIDSEGNSTVAQFYPLRDIYEEAPPSTNFGAVPLDLQSKIDAFKKEVEASGPFFNLDSEFYYWFVFRFFVARFCAHMYDLSQFYGSAENACAIFPRSKGASATKNNGEPWDYQAVIDVLKSVFQKIYVVGHPAHVLELKEQEGVELIITSDNERILRAVSKSKLLVSPHSGVVYLAPLLQKQFLIIYRGGNRVFDIGSIKNTLYYLNSLSGRHLIDYCFSLQELNTHIKTYKSKEFETP